MNRDLFLANIRQNLQTARLPQAGPDRPPAGSLPPFDPDSLAEPFCREVAALQGRAYRPETEAAAIEQIAAIFAAHNAAEFIAWDDEYLPLPGLSARLAERGFARREAAISPEPEARRAGLAALSPVPIGLTGAAAGLSDTGTLVLQSGPGRGRLASLLPPVHIALLKTDRLFPSLGHFVRAHPAAASETGNLALITGPSRTADIEQILTLGVHGPKELHIILV